MTEVEVDPDQSSSRFEYIRWLIRSANSHILFSPFSINKEGSCLEPRISNLSTSLIVINQISEIEMDIARQLHIYFPSPSSAIVRSPTVLLASVESHLEQIASETAQNVPSNTSQVCFLTVNNHCQQVGDEDASETLAIVTMTNDALAGNSQGQ